MDDEPIIRAILSCAVRLLPRMGGVREGLAGRVVLAGIVELRLAAYPPMLGG